MDHHADNTQYDSRCNCDKVCKVNLEAAAQQICDAAAIDPAFAQALEEFMNENDEALRRLAD